MSFMLIAIVSSIYIAYCTQKNKLWKKSISTFWDVIWKSMRPFPNCHKISKSLIKRKLKYFEGLGPNFYIWAFRSKITEVHLKSVLLSFLSAIRPVWKCLAVSKILVKILHFLWELWPNFHIWASWPKLKKSS